MKSQKMRGGCGNRSLVPLTSSIGLLIMLLVPQAALTNERGADHSVVVAPHSVVYGKTLQEWSAIWWKWAWMFPADDNPMLDTTGEKSKFGDLGRVFLLAGWFGTPPPGTIYRSVTIPENKYIFLSLESAADDNVLRGCTVPATTPCKNRLTIEQLFAELADVFKVTSLHASIDGKEVGNLWAHREIAPAFSYTLQLTDNLYETVNGYAGPDAVGTVFPAIADGYYLMLRPLAAGHHRINFGGTTMFAGNAQAIDITYEVTVTPIASLNPAALVP
jgi:hypothetical protein